jgi:integrase
VSILGGTGVARSEISKLLRKVKSGFGDHAACFWTEQGLVVLTIHSMPRKTQVSGPVGSGWVEEKATSEGVKYIAYWKKRVPDASSALGRRIVHGGSYDLGRKVRHGHGLTSLRAAKKKWNEIFKDVMSAAENAQPAPHSHSVVTFQSYATDVWIPSRSSRWAETSEYITHDYYFKTKLFPQFGSTPIAQMSDTKMQAYLNKLAEGGYSKTVVQHCLIYLRAVIRHAHANSVIPRDSSFDLIMRVKRPYLALAQFDALLAKLPSRRDKLMCRLLYFAGLRRGELFALRWKDWDGSAMMVDSQINRFYREGPVKTDASNDYVPLPQDIGAEIEAYKEWCEHIEPDDFMFPSKRHTPIGHKNWIDRVLSPAASAAGLPRINYHMFRRGLATEMHQDKVVDKNIQKQLRHSRATTTRDFYMQDVPEEQRAEVERFYRGKGQKT